MPLRWTYTSRKVRAVERNDVIGCERDLPAVRCLQHRRKAASFDNLVGANKQRRRYGEAERLCSLHIDDEFELGRLLDRQIGRLGASENFIDVVARTTEDVGQIRAVYDQSVSGELSEK